jgi:flavin-dependent dehydrogenase
VSTHALLRGGVLQLARWGVLDRVAATGTPPVRGCVFHFGESRVDVPIKPSPGVPALYAPRRTVLDPILVDAAREAGAEVRTGVTVTGLLRGQTGRVTGVAGVDERGAVFEASAWLTVGADGMGSRIARLTRAPVEQTGASAAAFVYGYWDHLPVVDYELFYRPGVAAGFFPTNHDQTCVFVATTPARYRRETRAAGVAGTYTRLLTEATCGALDAAGGDGAPERFRVFAGRRPGYLRRASGPGWALVGDAGYYKDPITSHGITDALRDAELLSRGIIAAHGTRAAAIDDYQTTRDHLSKPLFATTEAIASFTWNLDQIPRLLHQVSQDMADEVRCLTGLAPIGTGSGCVAQRRSARR